MALYRDLHANPELSMQEVAQRRPSWPPKRASSASPSPTSVGKTGVVAVMKNGPGPVLMLRADMDALPVVEQTGLPFASQGRAATARSGVETGVMHACGHDTHMTAWVGTARRLAAMKDQWSGTLVMIAPARRGDRPGRQGDARGRPLHPLPQARPTPSPSTTPRRCPPA